MSSNLFSQKTVSDFISYVSKLNNNKTAFEIRRKIINEKIFYQQLPTLTNNFTFFLQKNKISANSNILVWGTNCPEYVIALLGIFISGRIAVPIDYRTQQSTIEKIIDQTKPKAAFISKFLKQDIITDRVTKIFYIEDLFNDLLYLQSSRKSKLKTNPDKLCEIVYTSGTTGTPKGVMITQKNILENTFALYKRIPRINQYRTISVLPLSHMYEQIVGLMLALSLGSTITYLTNINSLRLKKAMYEIKPTYLLFVPQLIHIFWQRIEQKAIEQKKFNIILNIFKIAPFLPYQIRRKIFYAIQNEFGGKLEFIGVGGAPLNYKIADFFNKMGFKILEGYGATEITAAATYNDNACSLGHVGKPLDGVKIKLSIDNEILIKSNCVSKGYYKNTPQTKRVFKDGWYYTGDIGRFDDRGHLQIIGRDFFKIVLASGEKVYVEDIEKKVTLHPKIKDACVIGLKDKQADTIYAVFLLKNKGDKKYINDIIKEINNTLEEKQQIINFRIWHQQDLPRTHTLKVDRKIIKDYIEALKKGRVTKLISKIKTTVSDVVDILSRISRIDRDKIKDEDNLTSDLGLDSLDRGELIASIEEYLDISVDARNINSKSTVGQLKSLIKKSTKVSDIKFNYWHFSFYGEIIRYLIIKYLVVPIHSIPVKIVVDNPKNLKYVKPKNIIIFNHSGLFDGVVVIRLLKDKCHKLVTPVYDGMWSNKIYGILTELVAGGLPLDQSGKTLIPLLKLISDLVDQGRILLYAPQGRLQQGPVQDPFKVGIGYFAQELRLPVIPIKLSGYEEIFPSPIGGVSGLKFKDLIPKKRGVVHVKIGKPISPRSLKNPLEFANLIEEEFNAL